MRKIALAMLLLIITLFTGCLNVSESKNIKYTKQPLTKAQVDQIIAAANKSVIVDIDLSQVSKTDPAQQAEINERMRYRGENLKGKVTIENKNIVVARVNGETITASDWYWEKINKIIQAEYNNKSIPSSMELSSNLIEDKVISSTARSLGIYPPEEQVKAYIADQRKYLDNLQPEEFTILIQSWDISEEEYFLLMEDRFTDSLARINWGIYLEKYGNDATDNEQGYVAKSPSRVDADKIRPLLEEAKIEVTLEGRHLEIRY